MSIIEENSWHPWDCPETFGKQNFRNTLGQTHLVQWPIKLSKVSSLSPYFHKTHLLIAADCAAYAYSLFHHSILKGRVLTIGCPDIENEQLEEKLRDIIRLNDIESIRIVRMDAPCCKDYADMVIRAVMQSKKDIPIQITTVFAEGENVEAYGG